MTAVGLLPILGVGLLLVLAVDVLVTVFHPEGRGGPVNRQQNRLVWWLFRATGVGPGGVPRHGYLSFCGPVLAVLTILSWSLLLVAGCALLYYPMIGTFPVATGETESAWVKAVYYSGYVASTLGLGDVVPASPAFRLLTVGEALGGFALFTMSVTYVLAVYRELGAATALAMDLAGYFRHGLGRVLDLVDEGSEAVLDGWLDRTTAGLLRITHSHAQYPIIHYFHSSRADRSLLPQLGHLVGLLEAVDRADAPEPIRRFRERPALSALRVAVDEHLHEVSASVVPPDYERRQGEHAEESLAARHGRLLRYMLLDRFEGR